MRKWSKLGKGGVALPPTSVQVGILEQDPTAFSNSHVLWSLILLLTVIFKLHNLVLGAMWRFKNS